MDAARASLKLANTHYENFPVASFLLPMRLRRPIGLIYAFARTADDFADEGGWSPQQRLALLDDYRRELDRIERGEPPTSPLFDALADVIRTHRLPIRLFRDLLDAFSQDVVKQRYENFGEVMDYCRRSANPIGRLLLHLYGETDPRNLAYSDAICSALQLINFWQDVAIDYQKGRIYLPQDELRKFRVSERQIANGDPEGPWWPLMRFQIERTRRLLQAGAPLGLVLKGRIGLEMRSIIAGGEIILCKLYKARGDVFHHRPRLMPLDWVYMTYRAVRAK
ncbi:MAG: squalene synthase HpnC [Methylophilaceae bacterium]|nr:squalene synthase HpnC [Methylophilaceae bacterium]